MKQCSQCKQTLPDDMNFCSLCGGKAMEMRVEKDTRAICDHCKNENPPGLNFCIYCGNILKENHTTESVPAQNITVCKDCGESCAANVKFCRNCGAALAMQGKFQSQQTTTTANVNHQQGNDIQHSSSQQNAFSSGMPVKSQARQRRKSMPAIITAVVLIAAVFTGFILRPLWQDGIRKQRTERAKPGQAAKGESKNSLFPSDGAGGAYSSWPVFQENAFIESTAQSADVSPDRSKAILGNVAIDLKPWNLTGEDKIVVREFKERSSEDGSMKMKVYDLSLNSGQHEFITSVSVTIPCTADKNEDSSVMLFHSQTGEWEYVNYELSEDGKAFRVDVPHFSAISEVKVNKYIGTENDIRSTDGDLTSKGSMYQYKSVWGSDGTIIPLVMRDVYMSDSNFRRLFDSLDTNEVKRLLMQANMPSQDSVAFALGTLNNAHSLTDGMLLLNRVDSALTASGKIRLNGTMAGFGGLLTAGRIIYQANKGGDFAAILRENKYNIIEGILGGLSYGASYVGAATASTAFSVAAAVVFAWSMVTGYYDAVTEYDSMAEFGYRFYLDQKKPRFSTAVMGVRTAGDFELGLTGENHAKALKLIYDSYADKPKELDAAVSRFYNEYATLYWTALTKEERSDHYYKEYLGSPLIRPVWEEPSREKIDKMTKKVLGIAVSEGEQILRSFAVDALTRMQSELYKTVKTEVEPYLNEKLTFVVRDLSLKEGQTFDKSQYAAYPIEFADRLEPQFAPRFINLSSYTGDKYLPKARKNSNVIYECTMYHYIQMGCPTELTFAGNPDKGLPAITTSFKVEAGEVVVELTTQEEDPFRKYDAGYIQFDYSKLRYVDDGDTVIYYNINTNRIEGMYICFRNSDKKEVSRIDYFDSSIPDELLLYGETLQSWTINTHFYESGMMSSYSELMYDQTIGITVNKLYKKWYESGVISELTEFIEGNSNEVIYNEKIYLETGELYKESLITYTIKKDKSGYTYKDTKILFEKKTED